MPLQTILFVLAMYVLIQQIESAVLVPKVMERQVGLSPLSVILALAAGNLLGGLTGALVAVPRPFVPHEGIGVNRLQQQTFVARTLGQIMRFDTPMAEAYE